MRKLGFIAFVAAVACSAPASADIMRMTLVGDFNNPDLYGSWIYSVTYNTNLGVQSDYPGGGRVLSWDASSGTPSPVLAVDGFVGANSDPPWWWDPELPYTPPSDINFHWRDFTSFYLRLGSDDIDALSVDAVDGFVSTGLGSTSDFEGEIDFETEFSRGTLWYGGWSFPTNSPHLHVFSVERLTQSVPEPGTWALMLLGFFGCGAALRRRKLSSV